jgi:hypothetical protein
MGTLSAKSSTQSAARSILQDALFDTLGFEKDRILEWMEKKKTSWLICKEINISIVNKR